MVHAYRIAIADDNSDALFFLRLFVASSGHQVVAEAQSGEDLITRSLASTPDLILTDIKLNGLDGLTAVEKIAEAHEIPAIVVSAYFDEELIDRAKARVFAYLIKPVRESELAATIAISMQRFEQFQLLKQEASDTRQALEDRKDIERAKGIIMRKCGLDESAAFRHLQHVARANRQRLVYVARSILLGEQALANSLTSVSQ